jgi:hypothetical protein
LVVSIPRKRGWIALVVETPNHQVSFRHTELQIWVAKPVISGTESPIDAGIEVAGDFIQDQDERKYRDRKAELKHAIHRLQFECKVIFYDMVITRMYIGQDAVLTSAAYWQHFLSLG